MKAEGERYHAELDEVYSVKCQDWVYISCHVAGQVEEELDTLWFSFMAEYTKHCTTSELERVTREQLDKDADSDCKSVVGDDTAYATVLELKMRALSEKQLRYEQTC